MTTISRVSSDLSLAVIGRRFLMAATLACTVLVAPQGNAADKVKVTLPVSPITATVITDIGIQKGFFAEQGLDPSPAQAATGMAIMPLILNGQVTVGIGTMPLVINAVSNKVDLQILPVGTVASSDPKATQFLLVTGSGSPLKSLKDMKGKTIAVNSIGSGADALNRAMLADAGVDISSIKIIALPAASLWPAVKSGQADAAVILVPFLGQALAEGAVVLGKPEQYIPDALTTCLFISAEFGRKNPEIVKKILAGYAKAVDYANAHPDEVREISAKNTNTAVNPSLSVPKFSSTMTASAPVEKMAEILLKFGFIKSIPDLSNVIFKP